MQADEDLEQHPAVLAARDDLRQPPWMWAVYVGVLVFAVVSSAFFPWGFAPHP